MNTRLHALVKAAPVSFVPADAGLLQRKRAQSERRTVQPAQRTYGHNFSRVAIVGDEVTSMLPGRVLQSVHSRLFAASPAVLHEEKLEGQPSPDAEVDDTGAIPLDTADVAVPMSDTAATGKTKTGETGCDTATGKIVGGTLNTNECTKDCSTKHEDKHAADIAPCCTKAGAASKAATSESDKADIQTKFENWMLANEPFLECRAYAVSVSCGEAKHKKANCEKENYGKCCKALVWYIRSAISEGKTACNHADKKLSDCPFP